jgi:hypothetical protein
MNYPDDIYTEPSDVDVHTLKNLGPLTGIAGIWEGNRSLDVNPKAEGPLQQDFVEHIELQPIDPQANGPQLFYGLRYHTRIVKPGEIETYHDQVGYWLWEPATGNLIQTLAIPRGQTPWPLGARLQTPPARPIGTVPPHRSQHSDEDRRTDAQSACPRRLLGRE